MISLAVLVVRFWNSRFRSGSPIVHLQIVDSLALGKERMICMVKAGRSLLILGLTNHNITLLKEIDFSDFEHEMITTECKDAEKEDTKGFSLELLSRLSKRLRQSGPTIMISGLLLGFLFSGFFCGHALAAPESMIPGIEIKIDGETESGGLIQALGILAVLTVLTLAPAILILSTSFTRIVIVFSFLRTGLGTQQTPPNQVLVGLALLLTFFVMAPTWNHVNQLAVAPYLAGDLTAQEAFSLGQTPLKQFMLRQTREKDLALFIEMGHGEVSTPEDMSFIQVVPAFAISELKTAFEMGFVLFLPFLVVDMVVASTLMSMGMLMLPPVLISLPFKLLLFVLVDGWGLITRSLLGSFR